MKFREPLQVKCPACGIEFPASLAWVRQAGQACPTCGGDLSSIRDEIQQKIDEWRLVCNCMAISSKLEDCFTVVFNDEDIQDIITVADLVGVTNGLLRSKDQAVNQSELFEVVAGIIHRLSGRPVELIKPETELLRLGSLPLFV